MPRDDWSSPGLGTSGVGIGGSGSGLPSPGSLGGLDDFGSGHGRGAPLPQADVKMGSLRVIGARPPAVIERIVRQRLGMARACYLRGLMRNPRLEGHVNVRFVIGESGDVLSVGNAGDDIGDASVVDCVLGLFRGFSFPEPESPVAVTVLAPLTFRPSEPVYIAHPAPYVAPQPSATHRALDDAWRSQAEETLAKLRADVASNPTSRRKYEDLVRGLLAHGRFEEALAQAKQFVAMDPDLAVARELLAYAAVTNDDSALALLSVDTQTEAEPTSLKWHVRGARAFEAMGDERRACAHWRSLAELSPQSDEYAYESLRCRARVFADLEGVLSDARRIQKPGKLVGELLPALEMGRPPPFAKTAAGAGQLEATVTCTSGERCPTVFIVSPIGNVFSPFTPTDSRSSAKSVAVAGLRDGTYTTLLAGGSPDARGEIELRGFGSVKKFSIGHGGSQTVAATKITIPAPRTPIPVAMRGDGFLIAR
ncbi:MAG: AgmX/PglI C-terminal domain-containing protein [Polyangiaceae bacterium]